MPERKEKAHELDNIRDGFADLLQGLDGQISNLDSHIGRLIGHTPSDMPDSAAETAGVGTAVSALQSQLESFRHLLRRLSQAIDRIGEL